LKAGLVEVIGPEVIEVAIGANEEIFEDAVVGETDRVLFSVSVALAGTVELAVVALAGSVTVILGLSPIGTISYNDMAHGPPQVLLLSPA
jgi:acyl-[acyl carrier protein]--UDP-N-acetylglucosamine O-acyltransferase